MSTISPPLILASRSLSRQNILNKLGIPFTLAPESIDETPPPGLPPQDLPEYLARKKAKTVGEGLKVDSLKDANVLGADTLMLLGGRPYGKPKDEDEARRFLSEFSGKTHQVITGIALYRAATGATVSRTCSAYVTFATLDPAEIDRYLATKEWQGAAGAYRIQGLGAALVTRIDGLESTVAGLPIRPLVEILYGTGQKLPINEV
jgi:septum formation protein